MRHRESMGWPTMVFVAFLAGILLTSAFLTAIGVEAVKGFAGTDATAAAWWQAALSFLAVVVSLTIGLASWRATNRIAKAQARPIFYLVATSHVGEKIVLDLRNIGLGPGRITSVKVSLDGNEVDAPNSSFWADTLAKLEIPRRGTYGGQRLHRGLWIKAETDFEIFHLSVPTDFQDIELLVRQLSRLDIELSYESLQGGSWSTSWRGNDED